MSKRTLTTKFLKECLADSLIALMGEKDIEDISVIEITKRAGVSRSTWFRYFKNKEEVLTFKLDVLWERFAAEKGISAQPRFQLSNAYDFFLFNLKYRDLITLFFKKGLKNVIYNAFWDNVVPQVKGDAFYDYQILFYAHGVFGMLEEWCKKGFLETPEEMAKIFFRVIDDRSSLGSPSL